MHSDEWRTIKKCPNYEINSIGEIRKKSDGTIIHATVNKPIYGGYSITCLYNGEKRVGVRIHREVALAFLENPNGCKHVHHIDGNKQNNDVRNLLWVTPMEHAQYHRNT